MDRRWRLAEAHIRSFTWAKQDRDSGKSAGNLDTSLRHEYGCPIERGVDDKLGRASRSDGSSALHPSFCLAGAWREHKPHDAADQFDQATPWGSQAAKKHLASWSDRAERVISELNQDFTIESRY